MEAIASGYGKTEFIEGTRQNKSIHLDILEEMSQDRFADLKGIADSEVPLASDAVTSTTDVDHVGGDYYLST